MDKYEYKLRADEIKNLIGEGRYAEAVQIADTIDWKKVKSVRMLCTISDLYKINRRYEESREILLIANAHYPDGRYIIYSLCELSIKLQDIVHAIEYFKEFVRIAPHNTSRYILQYKLYVAQDVSLEERIAVLQEFKKHDYREKWGYELAFLYHRVGLTTECVEECDELFLWFGGGRYVMKALELKALHEPLSPEQQRVYDRYKAGLKEPAAAIEQSRDEAYDNERDEMGHDEDSNSKTQEESEDGEFHVKTVDVGQYNTINLQQVIAESLRELQRKPQTAVSSNTRVMRDEPASDPVPDDARDNTANTGVLGITEEDLNAFDESDAAQRGEADEPVKPEGDRAFVGSLRQTAQSIATDDTIWMPSIPDMARYAVGQEGSYLENAQYAEINAKTIAQATGEIPMAVPVDQRAGSGAESLRERVSPDDRSVEDALKQDIVTENEPSPERKLVDELNSEIVSAEDEAKKLRAAERRAELKSRERGGMREVSSDTRRLGQTREYLPLSQRMDKMVQAALSEPDTAEKGLDTPQFTAVPREEILQPAGERAGRVIKPSWKKDENSYDSLLAQGADGQISIAMDEEEALERQITGQISIEEFLAGWENHKKALHREQLNTMADAVRKKTDELFKEYDESERRDLQHRLEEAQEEAMRREREEELGLETEDLTDEVSRMGVDTGSDVGDDMAEGSSQDEPAPESAEGGALADTEKNGASTETKRLSKEEIAHQLAVLEGRIPKETPTESVTGKEDDAELKHVESGAAQPVPDDGAVEKAMDAPESASGGDQDSVGDTDDAFRVMTPEEKELFGPYIHKKRSRQQIVSAIDSLSMAAYAGNAIITGEEGAGTINLAKGLIRSVQLSDSNFSGQIAKISGRAMNRKRVDAIVDKLSGGALIIQGAAGMNNETTKAMLAALQSENKGIIVILEDTKKGMEKYLKKHPEIEEVFNVRVDVEPLATRELVAYARQYALDREYSMDEFAVLALHKRIDEMQTAEHEVTIAEVRDIVDDAVRRAAKKNPAHFFDILLQKRYDDDDMIILREKDFLK